MKIVKMVERITQAIAIVGNNQAGFEMQFQKDSETVINAEFKAAPLDNEGTLVIYKEDIK